MQTGASTPPEPNFRATILQGGTLLFGRQVISIVLKFIGVLLISRFLGPDGYGSYVAAYGIYQYALSLGQVGLGVCLLRHQGELSREDYGTSYTILAAMAVLLMVGIETTTGLLAGFVNVEGFGPVLRVFILAIPLQVLSLPGSVRLERALNFRSVVAVDIASQLIYYAIAVPLVLGGRGPIALAFAFVAQQAASFILFHTLSKTWPIFRFRPEIARHLLGYSLTFSLQNWIWQARNLVNPLIVGPALGASAVGLVGMTMGILEMLSFLKYIAWRLSVSVLRRVVDDRPRFLRAITQGVELQTLAIGTIVLGFGWFGQWIIPLVFGTRWLPVLSLYPYVALSYFSIAPFSIHVAALSVLDRNMPLAVYHTLHVAILATVAAIAVPLLGLRGYGLAEVATLPAYLLLHIQLVRAVGSPNYGLTALWWAGVATGLFWRDLGWWAIAVPFATLSVPASRRYVRELAQPLMQRFGRFTSGRSSRSEQVAGAATRVSPVD